MPAADDAPDASESDDTPLGAFIRKQREVQALTMRQLADLAGISNPYLSQIERGLREPSEKVIEALADNLALSADVLYRRAGRTASSGASAGAEAGEAVVSAIKADPRLSPRQRTAMLEIYKAFTTSGRRRA